MALLQAKQSKLCCIYELLFLAKCCNQFFHLDVIAVIIQALSNLVCTLIEITFEQYINQISRKVNILSDLSL
uniref:Uncharacterized protein n=1 Tax=Arundo donax TaxID=35708 RepID=A0A0A9HGT5_ARUDO